MSRSVFWFVFMPSGIVAVLFCCGLLLFDCGCAAPKEHRVDADFRALGSALKTYRMNARHYPTTGQGLDALVTKPATSPIPERWVQICVTTPKDPWGSAYDYRALPEDDPRGFELRSAGEDGRFGTKDDLSSTE